MMWIVPSDEISAELAALPSYFSHHLPTSFMPETPRTERVRRIIQRNFLELGSLSTVPPRETILVRNGFYCGYRFDQGDFRAVWFVEEDQVKFYGPEGSMRKVVVLGEAATEQRRKAA